jgi:hypothetical protein
VSTRSKGSLELVGEFFEVRTQVDRGLTTGSRVDRRLGLIKNLGCHSDKEPYPNRGEIGAKGPHVGTGKF